MRGARCPKPAKKRYRSPDTARRVAQALRELGLGRGDNVALYTYLCPCGFFHLTRRPQ